jgi:DNA-binding beta-propeller fold protein YncE
MVLSGGDLWVLNTIGDSVTEIDASSGRLVRVLSGAPYFFDHPVGVVANRVAIWVTNADTGTVTELRLPAGRQSGGGSPR